MSLQVTCERSSHLILLIITKLLSSFTYNEKILQCLSVYSNSPFGCIKLLVSVLNLAVTNRVIFLVVFELKLCHCFKIHSLGDLIVYY